MAEFKRDMEGVTINTLKKENLFTEKLRPDIEEGKVFFAIRPYHGSFYLKGRRLFNYEKNVFSTHYKFIPSVKGKTYITETDLKSMRIIESFQDGYERIKETTALYADTEATGVSALYTFAPSAKNKAERYFLVDIEVVFDSAKDTENPSNDKIDILLYDNQCKRLLFCEAKDFSNSELWAKPGEKPKVIDQLKRYNEQIVDRKPEILKAYAMAFDKYNQLMDTNLCPPEKVCDKCGLLIFGFDGWQEGKIEKLLVADKTLDGYKYKTIGNPTGIKIYDLFERLW